MSISSEITRINNNIASAYSKVEEKGGTLPGTQNSANLATAIDSISGGGGIDFAYAKIDATKTYRQTDGFKSLVTTIDMKDIKLENMQSFYITLRNLTTILNLDTSNTTNLQSAFNSCPNLVTIPEIDTSKVTKFTYCFGSCTNLQNVPVLNMSKITTSTGIQGVFDNCPALTNQSLNNIMESLATIDNLSYSKNLKWIGLSETQATTCTTLSNWQALVNKGWTTGY